MKIALVTTFNEKLYEYYAHRFLATYCWPFDCYIYHEGWTPKYLNDLSHFKLRNIHETNPELNAFIHRNLSRNVGSVDVMTLVELLRALIIKWMPLDFLIKYLLKHI
jgi:hypothetical protein